LIKLANKTSNLRAISFSPAPDWSVERRLEYVRQTFDVVVQVPRWVTVAGPQFDDTSENAEESVYHQ
jgi:hypothetical protein